MQLNIDIYIFDIYSFTSTTDHFIRRHTKILVMPNSGKNAGDNDNESDLRDYASKVLRELKKDGITPEAPKSVVGPKRKITPTNKITYNAASDGNEVVKKSRCSKSIRLRSKSNRKHQSCRRKSRQCRN